MTAPTPHKWNAAGDFYVEDGCCLSCTIPFEVAPNLLEWDGEGHCYVKKQPTSDLEIAQMVQAFEVADVGCIRYKGVQRTIQVRLVEMGEGLQCDVLPEDLAIRQRALSAQRREAVAHASLSAANRIRNALNSFVAWIRGKA